MPSYNHDLEVVLMPAHDGRNTSLIGRLLVSIDSVRVSAASAKKKDKGLSLSLRPPPVVLFCVVLTPPQLMQVECVML